MQSEQIAQVIQSFYFDVQGVYLFGSHTSGYERIDFEVNSKSYIVISPKIFFIHPTY
ncbi:MAG: hypothetical protein WCL57_02535 [Chloroflexota bacterium]